MFNNVTEGNGDTIVWFKISDRRYGRYYTRHKLIVSSECMVLRLYLRSKVKIMRGKGYELKENKDIETSRIKLNLFHETILVEKFSTVNLNF